MYRTLSAPLVPGVAHPRRDQVRGKQPEAERQPEAAEQGEAKRQATRVLHHSRILALPSQPSGSGTVLISWKPCVMALASGTEADLEREIP